MQLPQLVEDLCGRCKVELFQSDQCSGYEGGCTDRLFERFSPRWRPIPLHEPFSGCAEFAGEGIVQSKTPCTVPHDDVQSQSFGTVARAPEDGVRYGGSVGELAADGPLQSQWRQHGRDGIGLVPQRVHCDLFELGGDVRGLARSSCKPQPRALHCADGKSIGDVGCPPPLCAPVCISGDGVHQLGRCGAANDEGLRNRARRRVSENFSRAVPVTAVNRGTQRLHARHNRSFGVAARQRTSLHENRSRTALRDTHAPASARASPLFHPQN